MRDETLGDRFNLDRFLKAQKGVYGRALKELENGRKRSHWMWYIFPQIAGLGHSRMANFYAIGNAAEGRAYLGHPVLGARLKEASRVVLELEGLSISGIFGYPDDLKFRSSMTLFAEVAGEESVFNRVLDKYFAGEGDVRTLQRLSGIKD